MQPHELVHAIRYRIEPFLLGNAEVRPRDSIEQGVADLAIVIPRSVSKTIDRGQGSEDRKSKGPGVPIVVGAELTGIDSIGLQALIMQLRQNNRPAETQCRPTALIDEVTSQNAAGWAAQNVSTKAPSRRSAA